MTANSETRFAHLLEPIRDIAQNWSIDIALELEDYLTELESITISFDDGKQVDFTEAALLIQGSACVYSKKVEHLYTLVLNTLNQVVEKKKNAEKNKDGEERPAGAEDEEDEEDEDAFGCLEDTLKEVENVSQPVVGTAAMKDVRPFTLASAPVSLMPQQGTSNGHDETSSKMNLSSLHASGALLLPNVHIPLHVLATLPAPPPPPPASWRRRWRTRQYRWTTTTMTAACPTLTTAMMGGRRRSTRPRRPSTIRSFAPTRWASARWARRSALQRRPKSPELPYAAPGSSNRSRRRPSTRGRRSTRTTRAARPAGPSAVARLIACRPRMTRA